MLIINESKVGGMGGCTGHPNEPKLFRGSMVTPKYANLVTPKFDIFLYLFLVHWPIFSSGLALH